MAKRFLNKLGPTLAPALFLAAGALLCGQQPNPAPYISYALPASFAPNRGTALQLFGTGFVTDSVIYWNGVAQSQSSCQGGVPGVFPATCSVGIPATEVPPLGSVPVTVHSPGPGGGVSNTIWVNITGPTANLTFGQSATWPTGTGGPVQVMATADMDNDERPDVITIVQDPNVWQDGAGNVIPGPLVEIRLATGVILSVPLYSSDGTRLLNQDGLGLAVADFNNDGRPDLAVSAGSYLLLITQTQPNKFTQTSITRVCGPALVGACAHQQFGPTVAGDFNNDGKIDLAVASSDQFGYSLIVLLNNGNGTFTAKPTPANNANTSHVRLGDFNNDGNLDLAVQFQGGLSVLLGDGKGNFSVSYSTFLPETNLGVGDFNLDNKLDLVVSLNNQGSGPDFQVLFGDGRGSFTYGPSLTLPPVGEVQLLVDEFLVADIDGDGVLDIIGNAAGGRNLVLLGSMGGSFTLANTTGLSFSSPFALADINGDGRTDVVSAGFNSTVVLPQVPVGQLSPAPLAFGNQPVSTSSFPEAISINNVGSAPLFLGPATISNPSYADAYSITGGTCYSSPAPAPGYFVAPGSTCTVAVTFTPPFPNEYDVLFNSPWRNAPASSILLTGKGSEAVLTVTQNLVFAGNQPVGSQSSPQIVTVSNTGNALMTLKGFAINKNFVLSSNGCPATLAPSASCTLQVTFRPTVGGPIVGLLTVTSDAPDSPRYTLLRGGGAAPALTPSPSALAFASQGVQTSSPAQTLTLANNGTAPVIISTFALVGANAADFSFKQKCGSLPLSLAVGQSCPVAVTFLPLSTGTRTASLVITDSALDSPQSVSLSGTAFGNPVPSLSSITPLAVPVGWSVPSILTVSGAGFLPSSVIQVNGTKLSTEYGGGKLSAILKPKTFTDPGVANVTVYTPGPGGGVSRPLPLTISVPTSNVPLQRVDLGVGINPSVSVVDDFNGDGLPDLAVLNAGDGTLSILLGDAKNGLLETPAPIALPGRGPIAIATADLNKDGNLDIAVANSSSSNVTILLGDGKGGFTVAPASPGVDTTPTSIAIGDFNRDGNPDLVLTSIEHGTGSSITVLLGDGTGAFSPFGAPPAPGPYPTGIVTADFNRDGLLDLAVVNQLGPNLTIYLGDGAGNFAIAGSPVPVGDDASSIAVGDFNRDGNLDLAVANTGIVGRDPSKTVTILLGNGQGGFAPGTAVTTGTNPFGVIAADFNADGNLDIATANYGDNTVTVLLGDGHGNFASPSVVSVGENPFGLVAADFNADGRPDIVSLNWSAGDVSLLLGQAGTPLPALVQDTIWSNGPGLHNNQFIQSLNGQYRAIMQNDGNFVIYALNNTPIWASNTNGQGFPPYKLLMQSDGNLVVYANLNSCSPNTPCAPTWASNTAGQGTGPWLLKMQNDGNLVVYDSLLRPTWASGTNR